MVYLYKGRPETGDVAPPQAFILLLILKFLKYPP